MKKYLYILVLVCVLLCFMSACSPNNDAVSSEPEQAVSDVHDVEYTEGIFPQKDWDNFEFSFDRDCISDKQTAISIGKALLLNFQNQGYFPDYELQTVFYDTEDGIWILSFWESKDNYVGSDFSIAISEKDGQVIKMWVGE